MEGEVNERTHIDLFTGLAGFSIAARANGVRTIAMCECDPKCQAFLAKAWPGVPVWGDVRTFRLADTESRQHSEHTNRGRQPSQGRPELVSSYKGRIWLLTAGVPCQPASRAGKQRGAADDRWLWPHAINVFSSIRPAWALFENPPGIGDVGLAGILSQLEGEGYAVRVFSIPACAVGAPHRRERYWIVCRRLGDSQLHGRDWTQKPGSTCESKEEGRLLQHQRPITSSLADAPERGQREHGGASGSAGHADECGQGMGNSKSQGREVTERSRVHSEGRPSQCPDSSEGHWSNYVWLPCADGKVRRAPDSAVELVDGCPVDIIETLAKEGWPHRSILGALGNSVVWQIPAVIIAAMIKSEDTENNT